MASRNFSFLVLCVSLLLLMAITSCQGSFSSSKVALFIFGDSFYDVGNNNYLTNAFTRANFWPYGETFFNHPTGRASDGRLIPDFIAEYAKLPLIPPYLQPGNHEFTNGANFASSGAGALVGTHQGQVINLETQLRYFEKVKKQLRQKLGDTEAKKLLSKAVYMFSVGWNDYLVTIPQNSTILQLHTRKEYVGMVIGNITSVIQEIYKKGGRKFGMSKLIDMGCFPTLRVINANRMGKTARCWDEITLLAKLHNRALSKTLKKLERQLKEFKYSNFDAYTIGNEAMGNPSKYGFKEVVEACCGSGPLRGSLSTCGLEGYQLCDNVDEYFFFDGLHPTEKSNHQFANLMWNGSSPTVRPYSLKALFEKY